MKFSNIVSLAVCATSALAAPLAGASTGVAVRQSEVDGAVHDVDSLVTGDLGLGEVVDAIGSPAKRDGDLSKITSSGDIVKLLEGLLNSVTSQTGAINGTLSQVKSGKITKDQGATQVQKQFSAMHFKLTDIVTKLTDSAGITVAPTDVDKVVGLVVALLSELLATVKSLLTILGLRAQLSSILHSVFNLVSSLVVLLIGLVGGLVPGLVAGLSPLLAGLGNGLLAPLLTGVAGLLAGLTGP